MFCQTTFQTELFIFSSKLNQIEVVSSVATARNMEFSILIDGKEVSQIHMRTATVYYNDELGYVGIVVEGSRGTRTRINMTFNLPSAAKAELEAQLI